MASSKLSDADKQVILDLYRQPEETTSTLAERYGVSNSTISRVLKQNLPADEYSQLIQQKRSGATVSASAAPKASDSSPAVKDKAPPKSKARRKTAKPDSAPEPEAEPTPSVVSDKAPPKPKVVIKSPPPAAESLESSTPAAPIRRRPNVEAVVDADDDEAEQGAVTAWEDDETDDLDTGLEDVDSLEDEDYGDDDDLDEEDEDEDEDWTGPTSSPVSPRQEQLEILPFDQASFQRTCYLVVDRLAELITCPLRDFSDLGQIPKEEEQARTLPVFENHRIARRFSRRNQRVIKIPDASIIPKTQSYLQAKGITRLLLNGQVYALYD